MRVIVEILKNRDNDYPDLKIWRNTRYKKFTFWAIQNELLELIAQAVVRQMCACIRKPDAFPIIVVGTIDIAVQELQSNVVRYVDEDLLPHEVLGFFAQINGTTGEALSVMKWVDMRNENEMRNSE